MYVKDSVIEAQIEKDLKKQHVTGRIKEVEHQLSRWSKAKCSHSKLQQRLEKLRWELKLLSD